MSRHCRFLFLSVAAVAVGLAVGVWVLWPHTEITPENAAKIRKGMTLAEVEAILGGPARCDTTDSFRINPADFEGPVNFPISGCEDALTQKDGEVIGWRRGWVS